MAARERHVLRRKNQLMFRKMGKNASLLEFAVKQSCLINIQLVIHLNYSSTIYLNFFSIISWSISVKLWRIIEQIPSQIFLSFMVSLQNYPQGHNLSYSVITLDLTIFSSKLILMKFFLPAFFVHVINFFLGVLLFWWDQFLVYESFVALSFTLQWFIRGVITITLFIFYILLINLK